MVYKSQVTVLVLEDWNLNVRIIKSKRTGTVFITHPVCYYIHASMILVIDTVHVSIRNQTNVVGPSSAFIQMRDSFLNDRCVLIVIIIVINAED